MPQCIILSLHLNVNEYYILYNNAENFAKILEYIYFSEFPIPRNNPNKSQVFLSYEKITISKKTLEYLISANKFSIDFPAWVDVKYEQEWLAVEDVLN